MVSEVGMIPEVREVSKKGGGLQDGGGPRSGRFSGHKRPKKRNTSNSTHQLTMPQAGGKKSEITVSLLPKFTKSGF